MPTDKPAIEQYLQPAPPAVEPTPEIFDSPADTEEKINAQVAAARERMGITPVPEILAQAHNANLGRNDNWKPGDSYYQSTTPIKDELVKRKLMETPTSLSMTTKPEIAPTIEVAPIHNEILTDLKADTKHYKPLKDERRGHGTLRRAGAMVYKNFWEAVLRHQGKAT
jgi:hypothetical protein